MEREASLRVNCIGFEKGSEVCETCSIFHTVSTTYARLFFLCLFNCFVTLGYCAWSCTYLTPIFKESSALANSFPR